MLYPVKQQIVIAGLSGGASSITGTPGAGYRSRPPEPGDEAAVRGG